MKEHNERELTAEELLEIVGTGARPICFAEDEHSYIWGFGSCFIMNVAGSVFVLTAKHVIENQDAKYQHCRVLMLEGQVALPFSECYTPNFPDRENQDEIEDFVLFRVDEQLLYQESGLDLYSWDFVNRSCPTEMLKEGTQILLAGFPFQENRYDWENEKINEKLLIQVGYLSKSELGSGIYSFDAGPSDFSFNGLSGSPVFCRIDGYVNFIGVIIRGTSSSGKLHFIGSELILEALIYIEDEKA